MKQQQRREGKRVESEFFVFSGQIRLYSLILNIFLGSLPCAQSRETSACQFEPEHTGFIPRDIDKRIRKKVWRGDLENTQNWMGILL